MQISNELYSASVVAVRDCMGLKPGETVLVVTDEPMRLLGYALRQAAVDLGNEVLLVEMLPRRTNGEEPPPEVARLMAAYQVVFCPTSKSLTHTDSRRNASAGGARIATLPGVTEEITVRCMNADYPQIAKRTFRLCELLEQTDTVTIKAPGGTDLVLPIRGRKAHASSGLFHRPGEWGNLPTGEAYLAPVEGLSSGILVVDGSMAGVGITAEPIRIVVEEGYAAEISGGEEARKLEELLEPHGKDGRNVAEFGIGTNDKAILTGKIIEDEKVMGTIHVALGDNKSMGGSVRVASHLDGLVKSPTVWFDDRIVLDAGRLLLE